MTNKNTPGTWKTMDSGLPAKRIRVVDPEGRYIADIWPDDAEANARLISSAPDLLAALENFPVGPWPLLDQFIWNENVRLPLLEKITGEPMDPNRPKTWPGYQKD
jgi:hypothetical protein